MKPTTLNLLFSILVLTPAVFSEINIHIDTDEGYDSAKNFAVKGPLVLSCQVTATDNEKFNVKWEKDGKDLKASSGSRYTETTKDNEYGFKLADATDNDGGLYSCIAYDDEKELKRANVTLFSKVHIKTAANMNFVEGETIRIQCLVLGSPTPKLSWRVGNETYEEGRDRVELETENDIPNSVLVIKKAEMSDRGEYECIATSEYEERESHITMVRIKDKYAALWPFLGICAEVFILCAIILIYEKKRNKSELEESDTDQSPDQKNTPDHGKDSNLRHRQ